MQLASGFMQLAAAEPRGNILHFHCHFEGKMLLVCFVALCPKSTAMVMAGRSVHLTTLFPGQA